MKVRSWIPFLVVLLCARFGQTQQATNFIAKLEPTPPFSTVRATAKAKGIPSAGIDRSGSTNTLFSGDTVTTLVTLHEKHQRLTQWLICFEALTDSKESPSNPPAPMVLYTSTGSKFEFAHSPATIRVRTLGPFAEPNSRWKQPTLEDKSARVKVNETFLGLGLDQATAALSRLYELYRQKKDKVPFNFGVSSKAYSTSQTSRGRKMADALHITPEEERALAGGLPALFSYFNTIQQTPDLDTILRRVASMPSVWAIAKSLVKHGGFSPDIAIGHPTDRVGQLSLPSWGLSSDSQLYALPIEVSLCDHHALTVTFIVTAARPPLLTCGGIVGFLAENPDDKQNYLTLQVISAHSAKSTKEVRKAQPDVAPHQ